MDILSNILPFIHFLSFLVFLFLGIYVYKINNKAFVNRFCGGLMLSFSIWGLCNAISHHPNSTKIIAEYTHHIGVLGWAPFASLFLLMCLGFSENYNILKKKILYLFFIGFPVLFIILQWNNMVYSEYTRTSFGWEAVWSDSIWPIIFYIYYISFCIIGLIVICIHGYSSKNIIVKKQSRIIFLGAMVSLVLGTITDVIILEYITTDFPGIANILILVFAFSLVYAITKYKFLNRPLSVAAENIIANMSDSLILLNHLGQIIMINNAAYRLLGYTYKDLLRKPLDYILLKKDQKLVDKILHDKTIQGLNFCLENKRGELLNVIFSASVLYEAGNVSGIVCIINDITEQKMIERELHDHRQHLAKIVEARTKQLKQINKLLRKKIIERKEMERKWKRYESIVNTSKDFMSLVNKDYIYESVNQVYCKALRKKREEIVNCHVAEIWGEKIFQEQIKLNLDNCFKGKDIHVQAKFKFGYLGDRFMDVAYYPYYDRKKNITHAIVVSRDMTDTQVLEAELLQSQKMDAVGKLAGGIAHDFNNLLTVIQNNAHFVLDSLKKDDPKRRDISELMSASKRAADLTSQLLSFSRRQILKSEPINLNMLIQDLNKMLSRIIPENIQLVLKLDKKLKNIKADPNQMQQVIMNLVLNARDAMPKGGKISIHTENVLISEEVSNQYGSLLAGKYVQLTVKDTGEGISERNHVHIYDPFYTTKENGTGLGLSTVYGIIKQHQGVIHCESKVHKGTVFLIYLPCIESKAKNGNMNQKDSTIRKNKADHQYTILVVEDEASVRKTSKRILEKGGYKVLTAIGGEDGLKICEEKYKEIDLIFTDVVMPFGSGSELGAVVNTLYPKIKILYTSGYTEDVILRQGIHLDKIDFIAKPFSATALLKQVRKLIGKRN